MERDISTVDKLYEIFKKVDGPNMDGHLEAYLIGEEIIEREQKREFEDLSSSFYP